MPNSLPADAPEDPASRLAGTLARIARLEDRVLEIARAVSGSVAFSTSLGLEDQAVLHAIACAGAGVDVFTLDTGRHFPETLETLARTSSATAYASACLRRRRTSSRRWWRATASSAFASRSHARKACCEVRKVRPLRRGLEGAAAWITGLRRGQSAGRAQVPFAAWDARLRPREGQPDRGLDQRRSSSAYIAANDVPVNPLHARGFPSIGCQPCTRAIRPGEDIRAGRWWWENEDGKECGLHNATGCPGGGASA